MTEFELISALTPNPASHKIAPDHGVVDEFMLTNLPF
jgi:hypothetical protein